MDRYKGYGGLYNEYILNQSDVETLMNYTRYILFFWWNMWDVWSNYGFADEDVSIEIRVL